MSTLATQYVLVGMLDEAERTLQQLAAEFSEDTLTWISLAEHHLYTNLSYPKAAFIIARAIQVGLHTGQFLRQAYNTQARIARKLGDYPLLEETVCLLTEYKPPSGARDVRYEEDFLRALSEGIISPNVIQGYRAVLAHAKESRPR
jgi:hypothetical protein